MVADAIRDCSKRGDVILDIFGGYGTTLIAAERTGRKARLIELDPLYCDGTIRRWQTLAGQEAVLAATGQTFAEVLHERTMAEEAVGSLYEPHAANTDEGWGDDSLDDGDDA
jgi:DNA modification methylase